jgi:hypothetical protein
MNNWKTPNMFGTYSDSKIYPPMNNQRSLFGKRYGRKENMTFILGAKCSDGVVLVGDTKIILNDERRPLYSKKLDVPLAKSDIHEESNINDIVMGSAGLKMLYEDFKNRLQTRVNITLNNNSNVKTIKEESKDKIRRLQSLQEIDKIRQLESYQMVYPIEEDCISIHTGQGFKILVESIFNEMNKNYEYGHDGIMSELELICAHRMDSLKSELVTFTPPYGLPTPIDKYKVIGHGEQYIRLFLQEMWNPQLTMEQTAKLGIFLIKLIRDRNLDNSVGFNDEYLPQVFYIPNHAKSHELQTDKVMSFINEISPKITDFENFIKSEKFKMY